MTRKIIIYSLVAFVIAFIGSLISKYYIDYTTPDFLEEIIKESQNNKTLMKRIGGYKSYEYSYNENELKTDTVKFDIIVYGKSGQLKYTGFAVKYENNWEVRQLQDTIE